MKLSRLIMLSVIGMATMGVSCSGDTVRQEDDGQREPVAMQEDCKPIDMGQPNSPEQRPTFEGQTRACEMKIRNTVRCAGALQKPGKTLGGGAAAGWQPAYH
jgi:aldose sugar dehydrogenase